MRQDQAAFIGGWENKVELVPYFPAPVSPPPAKVKPADLEGLFGSQPLQEVPPGLYLFVEEGHLRLSGKEAGKGGLDFGRNETAYLGEKGDPMRLDRPKAFQLKK